jgi:hypothetical protein
MNGMTKYITNMVKKEDGMGTVEIVIIIVVLIGIALIFKNVIIEFVSNILSAIFDKADTINEIDVSGIVREITK